MIDGTKSITTAVQRSIESRTAPKFESPPEETPIFFDDVDEMKLRRLFGVRQLTDEDVIDIEEMVDRL
jgi:hypothetical protein